MDRLLSIAEVAALLQVSRATIYRLTDDEGLPFVRIGDRTRRFRESEVEAWLDGRIVGREAGRSHEVVTAGVSQGVSRSP